MNDLSIPKKSSAKIRWTFVLAAVFTVASVTDWALTRWLLHVDADAYEANPLAAFVLTRFGWAGLGMFKALGVGVVVAIGLYLVRIRPDAALRLMSAGCLVICGVLGYSSVLLIQSHGTEVDPGLSESKERFIRLENCGREGKHYAKVLEHLGGQLKYGVISLSDAVKVMNDETKRFKHFRVKEILGAYYEEEFDLETSLAIHLIRQTGFAMQLESQQWRDRRFRELVNEYHRYHHVIPEFASDSFNGEVVPQA